MFGTIFYAIFGSGEIQPWATKASDNSMELGEIVVETTVEQSEEKIEENDQ